MTSNKDIDQKNEDRVICMLNELRDFVNVQHIAINAQDQKLNAQQIQVDILEQELDLMKKRFDNLWEIFQDTQNADSKFKRELLELVGKL